MSKAKHPVEKADVAIAKTVRPFEENKLVRLLYKGSEAADQPPLMTATALTLVAGLATGNRRLARAGARMLATELLATGIKAIVKRSVDRTRPFAMRKRGYQRGKGRRNQKEFNSFPSGHTAGAVGVARALVREYPEAAAPAAVMAASVAAIQIPRAAHFASDVVAGAVIGLVAEHTVNAAFSAANSITNTRAIDFSDQ